MQSKLIDKDYEWLLPEHNRVALSRRRKLAEMYADCKEHVPHLKPTTIFNGIARKMGVKPNLVRTSAIEFGVYSACKRHKQTDANDSNATTRNTKGAVHGPGDGLATRHSP